MTRSAESPIGQSSEPSSRGDGRRAQRRAVAVASRVVAAVFAGYLLISLTTVLLGHLLPGPRADAVLTATMLSFALYAALIVWIFAARSERTVWRGLIAAIGITGLAVLLAQWLPI